MKVWKGNRELRCGFTTGSCAAAAAKAAAFILATGNAVETIEIMTPKGILYAPSIEHIERNQNGVRCSVKKDGGDDPDVTNGLYITAEVSWFSEMETDKSWPKGPRILIDGGEGVGRVTREGLDQPVGAAAINRVPRSMIEHEVRQVLERFQICRSVKVVISVAGGEETAKKTFNPRLGITGGISILGTTGIVSPMSEKALIDTIRTEMRLRVGQHQGCILAVPGNHGEHFCSIHYGIEEGNSVICSNYIGATIDAALEFHAQKLLLVGHIGKFIKLAAGIMNTHSKEADARMEILASHGVLCGADMNLTRRILGCVTTDEAVDILDREALLGPVADSVAEKMEFYLLRRAGEKLDVGAVFYSFEKGYIGETKRAQLILKDIQKKYKTARG